MDNYAIADNFSLLSKLMDIHGDNSFKAKTYSLAAFTIDKLPAQLAELPADKIFAIKGIGEATGQKILEQIETGRLSALDEYVTKTPLGILEMLKIKGLGPKKIATVWKELGVENIGELLYACDENRLLLYKGFGAKTQQNIKDAINFYISSQGSYLFSQIEGYVAEFTKRLEGHFPGKTFLITGSFNRHSEVIHKLEWVTDVGENVLEFYFESINYTVELNEDKVFAKGPENVALEFHCTANPFVFSKLFETSASPEFITEWKARFGWDTTKKYKSEAEIFASANVQFIPPFLRESASIIDAAASNNVPEVIQPEDIRGIIHTHSDWSDGNDTIEVMAKEAIRRGLEYLVITDHSKSAYYAQGLYEEKIKAQHKLIDELNEKLTPFKIFKSIESDILNDGNLDYDKATLETFDLVIGSVHSNLKMSEDKAMARLLKAISNPYLTILGHMTGRLLLSRNGYPVNYEEIIDACAKHNVVIELNAHPRRLDMDWRWIPRALEKGVLISIDPDAHAANAFSDIRYGTLAAQKGGLTKQHNLSSFTLQEFEAFLAQHKLKRH